MSFAISNSIQLTGPTSSRDLRVARVRETGPPVKAESTALSRQIRAVGVSKVDS